MVEDDSVLADIVRRGLVEAGYAVDVACDGEDGEHLAEMFPYDLIVLDLILPKKDGIEVCRSLRRKQVKSRILMLTCRDTVGDRIRGLDSGADDYLIKPFVFDELSARIRALLRREIANGSPILQAGELTLNTATREARRGDRNIELTSKEYAMLEYFMRNPDVVITRRMLEEHVWDLSLESESNLIEVYIRRLRQKIDGVNNDSLIETIRGAGYRLKAK